jgi:hypothetical protein
MSNLWFRAIRYLSYKTKAKDEFSIHSPWMYETYLQCIKGKNQHQLKQALRNLNDGSELYFFEGLSRHKELYLQWEDLRNAKDVSIDIDLYSIGIIIIKKGVSRQSYVLKR